MKWRAQIYFLSSKSWKMMEIHLEMLCCFHFIFLACEACSNDSNLSSKIHHILSVFLKMSSKYQSSIKTPMLHKIDYKWPLFLSFGTLVEKICISRKLSSKQLCLSVYKFWITLSGIVWSLYIKPKETSFPKICEQFSGHFPLCFLNIP